VGRGGARVRSGGVSGEDGRDDVMRWGGLGGIEEETHSEKAQRREREKEESQVQVQVQVHVRELIELLRKGQI